MSITYGYCRISTSKQNIDRQVRNIKSLYPDAVIIKEIYTGTKFQGRKELDKLLHILTSGDNLVFDSVSRMSRNADEGFSLYEDLYTRGINIFFLKEPHINTDTYKKAVSGSVELTGTIADYILEGVNNYLLALAKEQIRLAFEQSEKEVKDLQQRTKEGIETARLNGKQIGQKSGVKIDTKKSVEAKLLIKKYSKDFDGTLDANAVMKIAGVSKNSFYKYRKELFESELK